MNNAEAKKIKIGEILFDKKSGDKEEILEFRNTTVKGTLIIIIKCENLLTGEIKEFEHKKLKKEEDFTKINIDNKFCSDECSKKYSQDNTKLKEVIDNEIEIKKEEEIKLVEDKNDKIYSEELLNKSIKKNELLEKTIINKIVKEIKQESIMDKQLNKPLEEKINIDNNINIVESKSIFSYEEYSNSNFKCKSYINDSINGAKVAAILISKEEKTYCFKIVNSNNTYIIKGKSLNDVKKIWNKSKFSI